MSRLTALIPPPRIPVDPGSPNQRREVEADLELALPDDLFAFAHVYGSGEFETDEYSLLLGIVNPFAPNFVRSLRRWCRSFAPGRRDYSFFPGVPGLLPCGTGEGPRDLFFYTDGPPNHWPIMANAVDHRLVRLELSLTEYVFRLLDGSLDGELGVADNDFFRGQRGQIRFQPAR